MLLDGSTQHFVGPGSFCSDLVCCPPTCYYHVHLFLLFSSSLSARFGDCALLIHVYFCYFSPVCSVDPRRFGCPGLFLLRSTLLPAVVLSLCLSVYFFSVRLFQTCVLFVAYRVSSLPAPSCFLVKVIHCHLRRLKVHLAH